MQSKNLQKNLNHWMSQQCNSMIEKARQMGIESGRENTPPAHAPTINPYLYPLKVGFRGIWRNLQTEMNENKIKTLNDIDFERRANLARDSSEAIKDLGNKIKMVTEKLERVSNDGFNWIMFAVVLVIFGGLLFYEARMNSGFIMAIAPDITVRDARKISFFLYLAITICIMAAHYAASFITSRFWRKSLIVFAFGTIAIFLVGMAYVRTIFVNEGKFSLLSFIFFSIINLVFLAAISFLHSFAPTRFQFSNFLSRMVYKWKLNRLQSKLNTLTQQYKGHIRGGEDIIRDTQETIHSIGHYKTLLEGAYEQCLSEFVTYNLANRNDGLVPTIFGQIENQKLELE